MKIEIEQTKDFRELAKLNKTVQNWHYANFPNDFKPFENQEVESAFEKMIRNENFIAFIAKYKDKGIGYLLAYLKKRPDSAFQYEKTILYIDQVAVIEFFKKYLRRKVGLHTIYLEGNEEEISSYEDFKTTIENSKTELPSFFISWSKPLYNASIFSSRITSRFL